MKNYFGPVLFLILMVIMFILVPKERIKRFTMLGLVGGFGVALLLVALMQNLWHFWSFHQVDLLYIFKIPILLSAAWFPLEVIFAHLLIRISSSSGVNYPRPATRRSLSPLLPAAPETLDLLPLESLSDFPNLAGDPSGNRFLLVSNQ